MTGIERLKVNLFLLEDFTIDIVIQIEDENSDTPVTPTNIKIVFFSLRAAPVITTGCIWGEIRENIGTVCGLMIRKSIHKYSETLYRISYVLQDQSSLSIN